MGSTLLSWIPLLHPLPMPPGMRLWMVIPLVLCIAAVYRACRTRQARDIPWSTLRTAASILLGMAAIAASFYIVHLAAIRLA